MRADHRNRYRRRPARGQALIELLVACLVLLPLLAAGVMLARYENMASAGDDLARMVAQECAVRGLSCTSGEADASLRWQFRLWGPIDAPIESSPAHVAASAWRQPFWVDSQQRPLVAGEAAVSLQITEDSLDAGEAVARSSSSQAPALLAQAGPQRFGLAARDGLVRVRARLEARLADVDPWQWLGLPGMSFTARAAAVTDAWNVAGIFGDEPAHLEFHFLRGRDPLELAELSSAAGAEALPYESGARFQHTRSWLEAARARGLEPVAGDFRFGEIDLELVPEDRLGVAP